MTSDSNDVITLDPYLEQLIMDSVQKTEAGSFLTMDPAVTGKIVKNTSRQAERLAQTGKQPIVLASPVVRLYFKRLTEQAVPGLVVLSYNELDPSLDIQSIGIINAS